MRENESEREGEGRQASRTCIGEWLTFVRLFGIVIFIFELKPIHLMYEIFGFFKWWAGRGVFFILYAQSKLRALLQCLSINSVGSLCWFGWNNWYLVFSVTTIVIGVLFIVMHFIQYRYPPPLLGGEYTEVKS